MINKIKGEKLIKQNQGQIAIIVLLASAIILTLGLSASKSTITSTKVDTDEESLKTAFNTAESAINNYLNTGNNNYSSTEGNNATINATTIGNTNQLSSEGQVLVNTNQLFWLVSHNDNGNIGTSNADYYQGGDITLSVDNNYSGALKIDYFYIENDVYKVQRLGCNYNNSNVVNGYDSLTTNCSTLTVTNRKPLLIVVTPLGSPTSITIQGSSSFPVQGQELTSISTTSSGIKTQIKTIYLYQIPSFFIEAITARDPIQ